MSTIYDRYLENPPVEPTTGHPSRGGSARNAFWVGFNGGPKIGQPKSRTRLAWMAGVQARKEGNSKAITAQTELINWKKARNQYVD